MPPYSRHHKYSKKIECRHRGGNKKKKFPTFIRIVNQNSRLLLELKLKHCRILLELQLKNRRVLQKYK